MTFDCPICTFSLTSTEEDKQDIIENLYITDDGTLLTNSDKEWHLDLINNYIQPFSRLNRITSTTRDKRIKQRLTKPQLLHLVNISLKKYNEPVGTICGHIYHQRCLDKWFHVRYRQHSLPPTCPLCCAGLETFESVCRLDVKYVDEEVPKLAPTSVAPMSFVEHVKFGIILLIFGLLICFALHFGGTFNKYYTM